MTESFENEYVESGSEGNAFYRSFERKFRFYFLSGYLMRVIKALENQIVVWQPLYESVSTRRAREQKFTFKLEVPDTSPNQGNLK